MVQYDAYNIYDVLQYDKMGYYMEWKDTKHFVLELVFFFEFKYDMNFSNLAAM